MLTFRVVFSFTFLHQLEVRRFVRFVLCYGDFRAFESFECLDFDAIVITIIPNPHPSHILIIIILLMSVLIVDMLLSWIKFVMFAKYVGFSPKPVKWHLPKPLGHTRILNKTNFSTRQHQKLEEMQAPEEEEEE